MSSEVTIAVVGSINLDLVAKVRAFPRPGETVTDAVVSHYPGGKGANQALAAHRLGASVYMIGAVGDDPVADEALANLREAGVNLDHCLTIEGMATGQALIMVDASGENQIVVAPGANQAFEASHLRLPPTDAVIAQLQVPLATILEAARANDAFFCLNAAPARPIPGDLLQHADLLVVNEIEARELADCLAGYDGLLAVTRGARGASLERRGRVLARANPPAVNAVDTTGAGDAFTAALTLALVGGAEPPEALAHACVVGAMTTTRMGAQSSPTRAEVESRR